MNLDVEYQELSQMVAEHFQPRRPPGHPDGQLSLGELGPAVHTFRHRAELFLLASGGLEEADVDRMGLSSMMPDVILEKLRNARDYWKIQNKARVNPVSNTANEKKGPDKI